MGLAIRSDKCKSTMAGEEVTFLNHPVSPTPASLAPKAIAGAETALRKIENAPITIHQKLILLSLCVVPMVNYAPLVEITSDKADYEELTDVAQGVSTNQQKLRSPGRLPGVPKEKGGPGLLMPGFYHDELRRAWASLDVNKGTRPGGAVGGRPGTAREGDLLQPPPQPHTSFRTERRRADRGGKGPEGEGRLDHGAERGTCPGCHTARTLDRDMNCPKAAWTRTARHDMIVTCLYLRVSGKLNRSWKSRPTATSATRTRSPTSGSSTSGRR